MAAWLAVLEATWVAQALRNSVWTYPLVNAGHLLGVALLVGAILPLDLRLLGLWRAVPLVPLWQVLTRTAAAGLVVAIACGALLFVTRASEYAESGLFLSKMGVVLLGTVNAISLRRVGWDPADLDGGEHAPPHVRLAAGISLAGWLVALGLGRLVGYF